MTTGHLPRRGVGHPALACGARGALVAALDSFGDPLNIHGPGRAARRIIDDAREVVAPRDPRAAGRARVHVGRHRIGRARDLGRRPRDPRAGHPRRDRRCRAPRGRRRLPCPGERRLRGRHGAGRRRRPDRHGSVRGRDPHPRHAARQRAAREPRAGNPATGGRGRPPRAGVARPVPHRRVPDGRTAAGERRGARGRPALALCAQVRRTARRRGALRPAWGGRDRVSLRRRPRTQASLGHGEHAGHRLDGGRAQGVARRHGRPRGPRLDAHRAAPRTDRRGRPRGARPRSPDAPGAAPGVLQRRGARSRDADDGARRSGDPPGAPGPSAPASPTTRRPSWSRSASRTRRGSA